MTSPSRIAVCGGGVAAVEAMLALRDLLVIRPHIDLIAPNEKFLYPPMAVAEPFGLAETQLFDLAEIAEDLGVELHAGALARVQGEDHLLILRDGTSLEFDAAVVAVGAVRRTWLSGALSFGGPADVGAFADLLANLEGGEVTRVAFAAPSEMAWLLPLYELAMLTAARLAEQGIPGVELTVVTSEADPLAIFGAGASRALRDLLSDRGIRLRMGSDVRGLAPGRLELDVGGPVEVDVVVALPRLEGPHVAGLPCDAEGFIPIDEHCRVTGLDDVYAAGDGTTFPVKQGGIATQQADVASESIAADLGALSSPSTFEPMLRGMLLTGVAPMYLRASAGTGADGDEVAGNALWWPPTKIAGRHLGPYLTYACSLQRHVPLEDHPVSPRSLEAVEASHDEARDLALALAKVDALSGDFASALSWLEVIERLDGVLSSSCVQLRAEWQARAS